MVERELKRIEIFLNVGRWIRGVIDGRECRWESEGRGGGGKEVFWVCFCGDLKWV